MTGSRSFGISVTRTLRRDFRKWKEQELLHRRYKAVAIAAQEEAEKYKERFRKFGSNVETIEEDGAVKCLKFTVEQQPWGTYAESVHTLKEDDIAYVRRELLDCIVQGLMNHNIVQFLEHDNGPIGGRTYAAKLFVVPWEQMPHKRTIEIMQEAMENAT